MCVITIIDAMYIFLNTGLVVSAYIKFEDTGVHIATSVILPILTIGGVYTLYPLHIHTVTLLCVLQVCSGRHSHWMNG